MCRSMEEMWNEAIMTEKKDNARKILALGKLSREEIAECIGLLLEEVDKLAEELEPVKP